MAAAFADLDRHRARHDIAGSQILGGRRIALHEALAFGIGEIAAFAARALGDEAAGAINAGRVELHEFHVLQGQAGTQHHGIAVAGAGMRRGRREIGAAIAAGCNDRLMRAEAVDGAVIHRQRHDTAAGAIVHDEVECEVFDEEFRRVPERLAIKRMQHGMAGAVGGGTGALRRRAFAEIHHHAAEGALIDLAFLGAREGQAEMLEFVNGGRRIAAEIFDGVLIAQPVGALHRVIHVPAPVVRPHIGERRGDAALCRDGMGAGRKHLGDAGGLQSRLACAQCRAQSRAAGADHHDIESMIGDRIGAAMDGVASGNRCRCFGPFHRLSSQAPW